MGLEHVFGSKPVPLVLDFLMSFRHWDYSMRDISRATGVSFRTLQRVMPRLEATELVVRTRTEGRAQMYMINFECPLTQKLDAFAMDADLEFAEKQKRKVKLLHPPARIPVSKPRKKK
jgi:DNA-binding HxlR family transcriptional regulator